MGHLAKAVLLARRDKNLDQIALAQLLGLQSHGYISMIENGKVIPSRLRLDELEKALGLETGVLQNAALADEKAKKQSA